MKRGFDHAYALLIGVDENIVPDAALPYAARDVAALHDVLVDPNRCGYATGNVKVLTGKHSTHDGILEGLVWLRRKLKADISGSATAIIYFSGHGSIEAGRYYLIPYDLDSDRVEASALRAEVLSADIATLRPSRLFVVLDCCHAAGMGVKTFRSGVSGFPSVAIPPALYVAGGKGIAKASGGEYGLEPLGEGAGRAVLSSSRADQLSCMRKDGTMSIFTYYLIEALTGHAQPKGGATEVLVSDIMSHVHRRVPESARADRQVDQRPQSEVSGNFPVALLLGGAGLRAGEPAPDPSGPLRTARSEGTSYRATVKGSGAVAQGPGAVAVGAGGVFVGGKNTGNINTGTQIIDTQGGANVFGPVHIGRGDFVGRDRWSVGGAGSEERTERTATTRTPDVPRDDVRERLTEDDAQGYEGSNGSVLKAALLRLGLLKAGESLPPSYRKKSGMAGKSRLYFLFVPSGIGGINLVAKFDAPERARREWDQIEKLYSVDMALHAMLPIHGNRREDGVIIYRAAQGATLSGHCTDLAEYLDRQLESAPANCVRALDLGLDILALFYQRGGLAMAQEGKVIFWRTLFDTLAAKKHRLAQVAKDAWPQIDWSAERITPPTEIAGGRLLPNPLARFESLLEATTGQVMLSRVHGDLNLSNVLLGEDSAHAPASAFIIDLANCEEGKVTATDLARLETEFWHEAYAGMRDPDTGKRYAEPDLLRALVELRDCLEGRPVAGGAVPARLEQGCLRFVHRLRERAAVSLRGNFGDYLLEDFFHCLYLSGLNALAFPTVYEDPTKSRIALLGAALSLQALNDIKGGRYGPSADKRLASPLRSISNMLRDLTRGAGGGSATMR